MALIIPVPTDLIAIAKARSADPTKRAQFERIVMGLARELKGAARTGEQELFAAAAKRLDALWSKLTRAQQQRVLARVGTIVERHYVRMAVATAAKLEQFGRQVAQGTRRAFRKRFSPNISAGLTSNDRSFIARVSRSRSWYLRSHGEVVSEKVRNRAAEIIKAGSKAGLSDKQIARELKDAFSKRVIDASEAYYRVVANAALARTRSWASLQSFQEAGFEEWRYVSVLDERTSDQCRWLHGRTWKISTGISLLEYGEKEAARNPLSIKETMPWIRTSKDEKTGKQYLAFKRGDKTERLALIKRSAVGERDKIGSYSSIASDQRLASFGVIIPPTHGDCRSSMEPVTG